MSSGNISSQSLTSLYNLKPVPDLLEKLQNYCTKYVRAVSIGHK